MTGGGEERDRPLNDGRQLIVYPKNTIRILKEHNLTFHKSLGQNFLIDSHVLDKIMTAADITGDDTVLEIGPGIGAMTQLLAKRAGRVVAVEIDGALIAVLRETLSPYENVSLIHDDILKVDVKKLADEYNGGRPLKVVANLPYYITTPIVMGLYENHAPVLSVTVMVQREVARRMSAKPGGKDYGALSLAVSYYAVPYLVANVPRNCFIPRPSVDSAVIRLTGRPTPPVSVKDERFFFDVIRAAFGQRRKTLANSLANAKNLHVTKDDAARAIRLTGKTEAVRGEELGMEDFAKLADILLESRGTL